MSPSFVFASSSSCRCSLGAAISGRNQPKPSFSRKPPAPTIVRTNNTYIQNNSSIHYNDGGSNTGRREAIILMTAATMTLLSTADRPSLAENEKQRQPPGTCELTSVPSGLAFCDSVVGTGPPAAKGQLIKAHYIGKLENGKVFDSSYSRGSPLTFRVGVGEVIKGWDIGILGGEGLPPMLAGGRRTLKLPPELGYGIRGAGCRGGSCIIPPDSTLLFDVEFIG